MFIKPEMHVINNDLRVVVARTTAQVNSLIKETVQSREDELRFADAYPDLAARGLPKNEMAIFILSKNGVYVDSDNVDYDIQNRYISFPYVQERDRSQKTAAFFLVPHHKQRIRVDAREESNQSLFGFSGMPEIVIMGGGNGQFFVVDDLLQSYFMGARTSLKRGPQYVWNEDVIEDVVDLSLYLKDKNPNTTFLGVGHSPSYIIYAMDCLSKDQGDGGRAEHIPFSSRFLRASNSYSPGALIYNIDKHSSNYAAFKKYQKNYRAFLETLGLNPKNIVEKFVQSGEKTAVIDNVQSGTSFASFIYFMYEWADHLGVKKPFSDAFKCIALSDEPMPGTIVIPAADLVVKVEPVRIRPILRAALNANVSMEADRFISQYPPTAWGSPPEPLVPKDPAMVSKVKDEIRRVAQEKVSKRPAAKARQANTLKKDL